MVSLHIMLRYMQSAFDMVDAVASLNIHKPIHMLLQA